MNKVKVPNTVSYMMTVPKDKQEIKTPEAILYRLGKTKELKVSDVILSKRSNHPVAVIEYKGKKYMYIISNFIQKLSLSLRDMFLCINLPLMTSRFSSRNLPESQLL